MSNKINKEMTFHQVLEMGPQAAQVFSSFKLGCVGCLGASTETLAQGAKAHGLDVEEIVLALNAAFSD